jgi:hypothetical protein
MDDTLREKLRGEIMSARWPDLVYQFARGGLLLIAPTADLLEVALAVARDDRAHVEALLAQRTLWRASEEDARRHQHESTRFQFVIVQPWVIAQSLDS